MEVMMQSFQEGDPSPEPWLGDSRKIGLGMQEKALGFS